MIPVDEKSERFGRDVRQILRAGEVGILHGDNVGPVVTLRYLDSRAPIEVAVPVSMPPAEVRVARAVNRDDLSVESGPRIKWRWGKGAVIVESIDVSDTTDEYDVTLWLTMG